jgi:flagellar hook-associated protein 2
MSGVAGTSATSTGVATTVGTDLAPITFPGIASGIDYNSIITKLTSLTLAPNTQYNNQITQLNSKNAELIKINGLLASVQGALSSLSDPATFNAYAGTTTDPLDASVSQLPTGNAVPGSYTVMSTQVATSTQISGGASIGVTINATVALACAGTAIIPTNGVPIAGVPSSGQGLFTVDGVSMTYDVNSQSLDAIVSHIYASVSAVDSGFTISTGANGQITMSSTDQAISLGSNADRGNLEQVLKLDTAQVNNFGPPYTVTSAGPVGGVNLGHAFAAAGNAGFATAVTSGTFTINGTQITIDSSNDNVASVLAKINSSTAGVVASYDLTSDTFSLTDKATGPQSIVVGASGDSSNFLNATELSRGTGATTNVGTQAYVAVLTASGALRTTYSNSDSVAGAIPGMAINVSGSTSTPFTVTVAQNSSVAINAISTFVSAYNAAMSEISIATAAPVVQQTKSTTGSNTSSSSLLASGGPLYGDQTIESIGSRLTQMITGLTQNGNTSYNSLQSIGLSLDSSHTVYQSNTNAQGGTIDATQSGAVATTTVDGTDGQLLPLDVTSFAAAFAADPIAVANLFISTSNTSTTGLTNQIGSYLTGVTGFPTSLVTGLVGSIPVTSLLQSDENAGTAEITSLNQSIKSVTDKANAQADLLRAQATASEALVSKYQSEQSVVNQLSGTTSSSSS